MSRISIGVDGPGFESWRWWTKFAPYLLCISWLAITMFGITVYILAGLRAIILSWFSYHHSTGGIPLLGMCIVNKNWSARSVFTECQNPGGLIESTRLDCCLNTNSQKRSGDLILPHLKWFIFLSRFTYKNFHFEVFSKFIVYSSKFLKFYWFEVSY